ncbi:MAG: tRNA-dihydrouridine synthase [Candidatus Lokiarchaeota archaeon]|nr:tRNA-dihydrouridine synthase [Candidatus Lokiarchaeota archaeon]
MDNIHLAPMKNISCWAFRNSFRHISNSYTEMLNLNSLLHKKQKASKLIDTYKIPNQNQWLQVLTHNLSDMNDLPNFIKEFQNKYPEKKYIYGINLNACCPDLGVIAAGDGAALIKRTKRLIDLFKIFLRASSTDFLRISCKIRLGINLQEMKHNKVLNFIKELDNIDDDRISPTIIHFRHAQQNSDSTPHWEIIEDLLNCDHKIIINGGIGSINDIHKIQTYLSDNVREKWNERLSGIMIGKAVLKNPICIESISNISKKKVSLKYWKDQFIRGLKEHPPSYRFIKELNRTYQID